MPLLTLLGQTATNITIGGTANLGAITSSGGLQITDTIGGTATLDAITSSATLTVGLTIGGTAQLVAFTSTGGVDAGTEETQVGGVANKQRQQREQELRAKARKYAEEENKKLADKIFGDTAPVVKELMTTGKAEIAGTEVEMTPLKPPAYPISLLAQELDEIKDSTEREIAGLIRAQEDASYQKELATYKLKVQRFEEELIAFLILAMDV